MAKPARNPDSGASVRQEHTPENPSLSGEEFKEWWVSIYPRLLARAGRLAGASEAPDIVQDVAILALRKLKRAERRPFPSQQDFNHWAYSCVRYRALDRLRAFSRGTELLEEAKHPQDPVQYKRVVLRGTLLKALGNLTDRQRMVVRGFVGGKTTREIAEELGVEEATVRSVRRFAKHRLVEFFEENEVNQHRRLEENA